MFVLKKKYLNLLNRYNELSHYSAASQKRFTEMVLENNIKTYDFKKICDKAITVKTEKEYINLKDKIIYILDEYDKITKHKNEIIQWNNTTEIVPNVENKKEAGELIGFNKNWICEDFNPNGTRVCFFDCFGWHNARWNDSMDCWIMDSEDECGIESVPTCWTLMPCIKNK